jgi:hypothetical protein
MGCSMPHAATKQLMLCSGALVQIPIKGCRDVCFSNGGQYFAAINGITLSVYNTYTCECVGNLRGHNGKVKLLVKHGPAADSWLQQRTRFSGHAQLSVRVRTVLNQLQHWHWL